MQEQELAVPRGFRFGAGTAGVKASGSPDLAFAECAEGATAAAMFTSNRVTAAPLLVDKRNLEKTGGRVRALIVNSGNANCATGKDGIHACEQVCRAVAKVLGCKERVVFPSSTGVIGVPLPAEKLAKAVPQVIAGCGTDADSVRRFARSIMTTDTRMKTASTRVRIGDHDVTVLGMAKGAGMIHPRLATMLVYLFTDAEASAKQLDQALREAVATTFNRISVDGDTSTNDTVLLLASGASGARVKDGRKQFQAALDEVCGSLARQIVADAEGVRHVINLTIESARREQDAEQVARAIANSPLVKTAFAGADPNWGRVLAAVGYSGVEIDPDKVDIWFGPHRVCKNGVRAKFDERKVHTYLKDSVVDVRVALNQGKKSATFWTCDLTEEYVRINGEYMT
ncbi:MAG: bifunctional glutamate N-acetyltransferase/amino-acid acetyltransferase ArgJ [Terriglobales bacterium]